MRSAADDPEAFYRFSIDRYYPPTVETIPLRDPRWQETQEGSCQWRILELDDHFGADHARRWAISLLDVSKGVRFDRFAWRKTFSREQAMELLRETAGSLERKPLHAEHFSRSGTLQERLDQRRDARIASFLNSLVPVGIADVADGELVFAPTCAAWVDEDRKAVRAVRYLAEVPIDASLEWDKYSRPVLPLSLQPEQYPGSERNGLPDIYISMLYWNKANDQWHTSPLLKETANDMHPLRPIEEELGKRFNKVAVHRYLMDHYFLPPMLDDALRADEFLAR